MWTTPDIYADIVGPGGDQDRGPEMAADVAGEVGANSDSAQDALQSTENDPTGSEGGDGGDWGYTGGLESPCGGSDSLWYQRRGIGVPDMGKGGR